jgi:hypothetical protein
MPYAEKTHAAHQEEGSRMKTSSSPKKPVCQNTSEMVRKAITCSKEMNGFSMQAMKQYIPAIYKVDAEKFSHLIKST